MQREHHAQLEARARARSERLRRRGGRHEQREHEQSARDLARGGDRQAEQHEETDVRSFRMFTSQMIVNGTVKPKEIVKAFGVPSITVKRYVKVFRDHGAKGFYENKPRRSSASVLKGEVLERARTLYAKYVGH